MIGMIVCDNEEEERDDGVPTEDYATKDIISDAKGQLQRRLASLMRLAKIDKDTDGI